MKKDLTDLEKGKEFLERFNRLEYNRDRIGTFAIMKTNQIHSKKAASTVPSKAEKKISLLGFKKWGGDGHPEKFRGILL